MTARATGFFGSAFSLYSRQNLLRTVLLLPYAVLAPAVHHACIVLCLTDMAGMAALDRSAQLHSLLLRTCSQRAWGQSFAPHLPAWLEAGLAAQPGRAYQRQAADHIIGQVKLVHGACNPGLVQYQKQPLT